MLCLSQKLNLSSKRSSFIPLTKSKPLESLEVVKWELESLMCSQSIIKFNIE